MPRKSRSTFDKILSHHMVQGINREYIFETDKEKKQYLGLLKKYNVQFEIYVIAYCIMDNHAHMLLYSDKIQNISNFMKQVNSIYAMDYNKKKDRVGYVYRNRFKSVPIMTKEQMYSCIKYIHMNPIKAGLVKEESQYKYSSYHDYLNQTGFVNQKILEFVFNSSENYIERFQNIKYENLRIEKEKCDIKKLYNHFLKKEKINRFEMKKNKVIVQKFVNYLNTTQYTFSKSEIAEALEISRTTLYRWLHDK